MATGGEEDMFQLLPSDLRGIEEADKYAMSRRLELESLKLSVKKMGWFRTFWDSKIPQAERGILNISFSHTAPAAIQAEIEKCLSLYLKMMEAVKKVDEDEKSVDERENPFLVILHLNGVLNNLFDTAQSSIMRTNSKKIAELYQKFVAKQPELENKIKKLECVYLKQQLQRKEEKDRDEKEENRRRREEQQRLYEQSIGEVQSYIVDLRGDNDQLVAAINALTRRLDAQGI